MGIVSKINFKHNLKNYTRDDVEEMLYRAFDEITRIENRSKSIWYKDDLFLTKEDTQKVDETSILEMLENKLRKELFEYATGWFPQDMETTIKTGEHVNTLKHVLELLYEIKNGEVS